MVSKPGQDLVGSGIRTKVLFGVRHFLGVLANPPGTVCLMGRGLKPIQRHLKALLCSELVVVEDRQEWEDLVG